MHTLAIGSTIAVLSAWAAAPTGLTFNSNLAQTFADALSQEQQCHAVDVHLDQSGVLVVLDEHGHVTEFDVAGMRSGSGYGVAASMIPAMAVGAVNQHEEEVDVSVEVTGEGGRIVINHNGEIRELDLDLDDLDFADLMHDDDGTLHGLLDRLMAGDVTPEVHAEVIVEMEDEDGHRTRRRARLGGNEHPEHMMMWQDEHGEAWMFEPHGQPRGMRGMEQNMLRRHMEFMHMLHEDPDAVMDMLHHLPPEMRREHEVLLAEMMESRAHAEHREDDYVHQAAQFAEKMQMTRQVGGLLEDGRAMAIFGVWYARERMAPDGRIRLLASMVDNEDLYPAVRNAAAWVVMEAQAELGESAAGAESLRKLILRNGNMQRN